jgi:hypothetical protein
MVVLVFLVATGRELDGQRSKLVFAQCVACTAGSNHPCCSHKVTALAGLCMLQAGDIAGGNIGDGVRAWGVQRTSAVPVQSINTIANLTSSGPLSRFTGFRDGTSPGPSAMDRYISLYQQYAKPNAPATIIEIHRGAAIVRNNQSLHKRGAPGAIDPALARKRSRPALVEVLGPVTFPGTAATTAPVDDPMDVDAYSDDEQKERDARLLECAQREKDQQFQDDLLRQLQQEDQPEDLLSQNSQWPVYNSLDFEEQWCDGCNVIIKELTAAQYCPTCDVVAHPWCVSRVCEHVACSSASSSSSSSSSSSGSV